MRHSSVIIQAAERTGCTPEQWVERRRAGFRWCIHCRTWLPGDQFGRDAARADNKNLRCRPCCRSLGRKRGTPINSDVCIALETMDPRFNPAKPVTINGYRYLPEPGRHKPK